MPLSDAQRLKFRLLAEGMTITSAAQERLDSLRGRRKLTPADFASTSGVIVRLDDDVWVNVPIGERNRRFVVQPHYSLDVSSEGFCVRGGGFSNSASVWLPPLYHDKPLSDGRPANHFVFTHGDRVRLSPVRGCANRCRFCNVPYEDPYELKPVDLMIEALEKAFTDPLQPAQHALISGGTPRPGNVSFLRAVYEKVLLAFPDRDIDIMMVPCEGLLDLPRLRDLGVNGLSINIELVSDSARRKWMPEKGKLSYRYYLETLEKAVEVLGPGRVRSMLLVGLEPLSETVKGVKAILEAGCIPVLSPFRPDPSTPLRGMMAPSAELLEEAFLQAAEVAGSVGAQLGPSCPPCTHNTLAFAQAGQEGDRYLYPVPELV